MKSKTCMFAIILVIAVGCDSPDERLVNQLADTTREVVQQNQEVARSHHELAEGSKRLVEAVAESRHEHSEQQSSLQKQMDLLELERKSIASARLRESWLCPVINTTGGLLVATLPLVLCWYLLHGLRSESEEVSEVVIEQLVRQTPELLGTANNDQRSIEHQRTPARDEVPPF